MTTAGILWPTKLEYDLAIAKWTETIWDADLRASILTTDNLGICRFGGANLYVCIYKIGNWMVRCFCSQSANPPPDIQERYSAIDRFCRSHANRVSALVPISYIEQGITVGMRTLPIVKMPFLAGCPSLGEFLVDHYRDKESMLRLSDAWQLMIRELESVPMAHGDLDLSNVLVEQRPSHLTLKLIDYDNLWVPELAGRKQTEHGHPSFQHPSFLPPRERPYDAEMDRFSALVFYISLQTIISHPELYEQWGADEAERLLLSETDYENAGLVGSRMMQLRALSDAELHPYIDELNAALREERMPRSLYSISYEVVSRPAPPQQVEPQRYTFVQAPALSIWKDAVYNANALYPATPAQSYAPPSWSGEANMPSTSPWNANGSYHLGDRDEGGGTMDFWGAQPPSANVPWNGANTPQTPFSSQPWNAGASSQQPPPPPAWGSPGMNQAMDASPTSLNPAEKSQNKRKILFILAICLLSLMIIAAIVVLAIYFVTNRQGAGITPSLSAHSGAINMMITTLMYRKWPS